MMDQIHIQITHGSVSNKNGSFPFKHLHCTDIAIQRCIRFYLWTLCKLMFMVFPTNENKEKHKRKWKWKWIEGTQGNLATKTNNYKNGRYGNIDRKQIVP